MATNGVAIRCVLWISHRYGHHCRQLPRVLSFVICAGESVERKNQQLACSSVIKKDTGSISIRDFGSIDHRVGCYQQPDALLTQHRFGFCKGSTDCNSVAKRNGKEDLPLV